MEFCTGNGVHSPGGRGGIIGQQRLFRRDWWPNRCLPDRCPRAEEIDGHSESGTSVSMTIRIQKNLGSKKQILMSKVMQVDGEWERRWGSGKGKTGEVNKGLLGKWRWRPEARGESQAECQRYLEGGLGSWQCSGERGRSPRAKIGFWTWSAGNMVVLSQEGKCKRKGRFDL